MRAYFSWLLTISLILSQTPAAFAESLPVQDIVNHFEKEQIHLHTLELQKRFADLDSWEKFGQQVRQSFATESEKREEILSAVNQVKKHAFHKPEIIRSPHGFTMKGSGLSVNFNLKDGTLTANGETFHFLFKKPAEIYSFLVKALGETRKTTTMFSFFISEAHAEPTTVILSIIAIASFVLGADMIASMVRSIRCEGRVQNFETKIDEARLECKRQLREHDSQVPNHFIVLIDQGVISREDCLTQLKKMKSFRENMSLLIPGDSGRSCMGDEQAQILCIHMRGLQRCARELKMMKTRVNQAGRNAPQEKSAPVQQRRSSISGARQQ